MDHVLQRLAMKKNGAPIGRMLRTMAAYEPSLHLTLSEEADGVIRLHLHFTRVLGMVVLEDSMFININRLKLEDIPPALSVMLQRFHEKVLQYVAQQPPHMVHITVGGRTQDIPQPKAQVH